MGAIRKEERVSYLNQIRHDASHICDSDVRDELVKQHRELCEKWNLPQMQIPAGSV